MQDAHHSQIVIHVTVESYSLPLWRRPSYMLWLPILPVVVVVVVAVAVVVVVVFPQGAKAAKG